MIFNIVFAGTPEFAINPLQALLQSKHHIAAVFTQPDRPAGRGRILHVSPVKKIAEQHQLPVYQPERLKDPATQEILRNLQPDLLVVVAYGLILPKAVLEIPRNGCINIHASLLPRWRGAAPIQHAILAGDKVTGITTMQMDAGLDTGDILITNACEITAQETSQSLQDKLSPLGATTLLETLEQLEKDLLSPQKQNEAEATYAHKIEKIQAKIHWQESALVIDRKIRAYNPSPVAFSELQDEIVRVWRATPLNTTTTTTPGTILKADHTGIDVATGYGILRLLELQLAGGKRLGVREILNSKSSLFAVGAFFK